LHAAHKVVAFVSGWVKLFQRQIFALSHRRGALAAQLHARYQAR
jgi:hypothetical protein